MILQALTKHYEVLAEQGKVAEIGWCQAKVSYALDIARDGTLLGIISLKQEETRGKKSVMVPCLMKVPEMVSRASGVFANFLCDNSKYVLGVDEKGCNKRTQECFEAMKARQLELLEHAEGKAAEAVRNFFLCWNPEKAKENEDLAEKWEEVTGGGNLVFLTEEGYAHEDTEICRIWGQAVQTSSKEAEGVCMVTGKRTEIARIHSVIKGVPGAQSSGAKLVSFNDSAFESYGKEQSYNAPVGRYAAFAYATALNYLLAPESHCSYRLGETMVVFWAESAQEEYSKVFLDCFEPQESNQDILKNVFENLQKGKAIDIEGIHLNAEEPFHILGLAPNAARLSVRFFYSDSFGNILENLRRHYKRMEIVKPKWAQADCLGIWEMLSETINQKSKEKKPRENMGAAVFRAILADGKYPESLYGATMLRVRAEQGGVTRGRAAIIKAHLIRNYKNQWIKEGTFVALNEECNSPAYVLGREFAVLEKIQKEAAGTELNTTIKDRYFNAACATPASIFPILQKLSNSHLRKLEKKKIYFERMLIELQGKIAAGSQAQTAYPKRLSLEEQGMFILGYYHQVQKLYEKKEEK